MALLVGVLGNGGVEFGIIVYLEVDTCARHGVAVGVAYAEVHLCCRGIVGCEVNLGKVACAQHNLLRSLVVAKGTRVHKHGT